MDEMFRPAAGASPAGPEPTGQVDPFLARRVEARPWELRAAQWRAWVLAEHAFGGPVEISLVGRPGYQGFRGFLNLTVPFRSLEDHRLRESLFLAWAWDDPALSRVPLLFVFDPNPVPVP